MLNNEKTFFNLKKLSVRLYSRSKPIKGVKGLTGFTIFISPSENRPCNYFTIYINRSNKL